MKDKINYIKQDFENCQGLWGHQKKLKKAIEALITENEYLLKGNRALVKVNKNLQKRLGGK